jgi:hypothetical protein
MAGLGWTYLDLAGFDHSAKQDKSEDTRRGGNHRTHTREVCAPSKSILKLYVKEQTPKTFEVGEHSGPPVRILAEDGKNRWFVTTYK